MGQGVSHEARSSGAFRASCTFICPNLSSNTLTARHYRFAGEQARQYSERLRDEMDRRRLKFAPIDWHG